MTICTGLIASTNNYISIYSQINISISVRSYVFLCTFCNWDETSQSCCSYIWDNVRGERVRSGGVGRLRGALPYPLPHCDETLVSCWAHLREGKSADMAIFNAVYETKKVVVSTTQKKRLHKL